MKKFEYKRVNCKMNDDKNIEYLNSLGKEGWEAYAIYVFFGQTIYMKREIED